MRIWAHTAYRRTAYRPVPSQRRGGTYTAVTGVGGGRAVRYLDHAEPEQLSGIRRAGAVAPPRGGRGVGPWHAVHPARGVRAAERGRGLDQRGAGGVRAAGGRREGDPSGADAHFQRRLAAAGEGRPADPLAAYPGREEAAGGRGQAHLLLRP